MAKANSDAVWTEINPETLPDDVKAFYDAYKASYRVMKDNRLGFETKLSEMADLPSDKRMVFGYNFGKLSVAIVDDDRKPAKATPAKQSLADWLGKQRKSGARV